MGTEDERSKFAAACTACGKIYAVRTSASGRIIPIGARNGCQCGATEFEPITDAGGSGSEAISD